MKKILLDTNTYSLLKKGDKKVKKYIDLADRVLISSIVIGELYSGFFRGLKFKENVSDLNILLSDSKFYIVNAGQKTGKIYGELLAFLMKSGKPIPTNDIWIAASAIETDSEIITYDRHFLKIPQVKVWKDLK